MFFQLAIVVFPIQSWGADLYAIIVADTLAPDIGLSVIADLNTLQNKIKSISKYTGLTLKEVIFDGESLSTSSLLTKLDEMEIKNDDVVIFYYSGHGYRAFSKDKDNLWPTLFFSKENRGIDFYALVKTIIQKQPRFFLSLADCCNNVIFDNYITEVKFHPSMKAVINRPLKERMRNNYEALFLTSRGILVISSSKAGEFSWGTQFGGLYTMAFFENLEVETKGFQKASWETILEHSYLDVIELQNPIYLRIP